MTNGNCFIQRTAGVCSIATSQLCYNRKKEGQVYWIDIVEATVICQEEDHKDNCKIEREKKDLNFLLIK